MLRYLFLFALLTPLRSFGYSLDTLCIDTAGKINEWTYGMTVKRDGNRIFHGVHEKSVYKSTRCATIYKRGNRARFVTFNNDSLGLEISYQHREIIGGLPFFRTTKRLTSVRVSKGQTVEGIRPGVSNLDDVFRIYPGARTYHYGRRTDICVGRISFSFGEDGILKYIELG